MSAREPQRAELPVAGRTPARGAGCGDPGVAGTSASRPPHTPEGTPAPWEAAGGKVRVAAGELPALGRAAAGTGRDGGGRCAGPRGGANDGNAPGRFSREPRRPEAGRKAQRTNTAPCTIRAKMTAAKLLRNPTGKPGSSRSIWPWATWSGGRRRRFPGACGGPAVRVGRAGSPTGIGC